MCQKGILRSDDQPDSDADNAGYLSARKRDLSATIESSDKSEGRVEQLTAELAQANHELAAINKEFELFCYSVSHHLRAPLRAFDSFGEIMLRQYADQLDVNCADFLRRISTESRRMGRLVDDILKLSRITRREVHRTSVDLSHLAMEVLAALRLTDPERRVQAVVPSQLNAEGDADLLRILFESLLGNAWKYSREKAEAVIELGLTESDGVRAWFVRDNGVGFDMAYAVQLFTPFQRLHSHKEPEGTGIGLATAHRIVARHGGRIWAEGWPSDGATFYFTLSP